MFRKAARRRRPPGAEQHTNSEAKEKAPAEPRPQPTKMNSFVGAITESDARPTGVQLKKAA